MVLWIMIFINRKDDIEAKYYADGEDAFAMRRELTGVVQRINPDKAALAKRHKRRLPGTLLPPTDPKKSES